MNESSKPLARHCPSCHHGAAAPLVSIGDVPIFCNVLWRTEESARAASRGELSLVVCGRCGLIRNAAFEPERIQYSPAYENSLHHSPRFAGFLQRLADRLVKRHALYDKSIVEIGCGDGSFLRQLCRLGGSLGIGFDPALGTSRALVEGIRLEACTFDPRRLDEPADLVCSRHVLEHLHQPASMLDEVRGVISALGGAFYAEVPDAWPTISGVGIWDLLYEHCLYFTQPSLVHLFQSRGYDVQDVRTPFDNQFLSIEAATGTASARPWTSRLETTQVLDAAGMFPERFSRLIERWNRRLESWNAAGRTFVLWGAGTKGVMFLNLVQAARHARGIVDLNPRKQGCFTAGTGHAVLAPQELPRLRPAAVLVMNGAYREEIRQMLTDMDLSPEVVVVSDDAADQDRQAA